MTAAAPHRGGRPKKDVKAVHLTLPPYLIAWAKQYPGGMSGLVHRLLRETYEREQPAALLLRTPGASYP